MYHQELHALKFKNWFFPFHKCRLYLHKGIFNTAWGEAATAFVMLFDLIMKQYLQWFILTLAPTVYSALCEISNNQLSPKSQRNQSLQHLGELEHHGLLLESGAAWAFCLIANLCMCSTHISHSQFSTCSGTQVRSERRKIVKEMNLTVTLSKAITDFFCIFVIVLLVDAKKISQLCLIERIIR